VNQRGVASFRSILFIPYNNRKEVGSIYGGCGMSSSLAPGRCGVERLAWT